jgi:anti-sigma factor RsiW
MEPEVDRRQLVEALLSDTVPAPGDSFSEETLLTYLDGTLPVAEHDRLQERLATSPEGTAKLLQLAALADAERPATAAEREQATAGLRDLRRRLADEGLLEDAPEQGSRARHHGNVASNRGRAGWRLFRDRWRPAFAAGLAAATTAAVALGVWLLPLRTAAPVLIANVRPALATGTVRATGDERYPAAGPGQEVELTHGEAGEVAVEKGEVVYLKLLASREAESCRVQVTLPGGEESLLPGLTPYRYLAFFAIERPQPGVYRIRLRCGEVGGEDRYTLNVRTGDGG